MIKVEFSADNLVKMLDAFHTASQGGTLFYLANLQHGADRYAASRLIENVGPLLIGEQGQTTYRIGSEDYMVHYFLGGKTFGE